MKINSKLRPDAKAAIINIVTSAMERDHNYLYQSCINCENFVEKTEQCILAKARPPVRILVYGCEKWTDRDIIPY